MRRDKLVKDKRILLKPGGHLAVVEYYRDTPSRDGDEDIRELCESFRDAQKLLMRYPKVRWEEPIMTDSNYREIDERKKRYGIGATETEASQHVEALFAGCGADILAGRSFTGSC